MGALEFLWMPVMDVHAELSSSNFTKAEPIVPEEPIIRARKECGTRGINEGRKLASSQFSE
jgi:hypothetical protein